MDIDALAGQSARRVGSSLRRFARAIGSGVSGIFSRYFDRFRVVEFFAATGAGYTGMVQLGNQLGIRADATHTVAVVAAVFAALMYVRNPKRAEWEAPAGRGEGDDE
jgi:hypothetical protein